MSEYDYLIIENMATHGGSFVKALANAARFADDDNLDRIKNTWPEYWTLYSSPLFPNARTHRVNEND